MFVEISVEALVVGDVVYADVDVVCLIVEVNISTVDEVEAICVVNKIIEDRVEEWEKVDFVESVVSIVTFLVEKGVVVCGIVIDDEAIVEDVIKIVDAVDALVDTLIIVDVVIDDIVGLVEDTCIDVVIVAACVVTNNFVV